MSILHFCSKLPLTTMDCLKGHWSTVFPVHNMSALMEKMYFSVGRMFAASVLQGGPAPTFLAESIADYLLYGLEGVDTHSEDVPCSVQDLIEKVRSIYRCTSLI